MCVCVCVCVCACVCVCVHVCVYGGGLCIWVEGRRNFVRSVCGVGLVHGLKVCI